MHALLMEDELAAGVSDCDGERLELSDGARAEVAATGDDESICVYSPAGRLLFQYDAATRTTRVYMPDGDLELVNPRGRVRLGGAGGVQIDGPEVSVAARRLRVAADETICSGRALTGRFERVRLVARSLETVAETITETAVDAFRRVGRLFRLTCRRSRVTVAEDARTNAGTIVMQSDEDTKIRGRQIHLG